MGRNASGFNRLAADIRGRATFSRISHLPRRASLCSARRRRQAEIAHAPRSDSGHPLSDSRAKTPVNQAGGSRNPRSCAFRTRQHNAPASADSAKPNVIDPNRSRSRPRSDQRFVLSTPVPKRRVHISCAAPASISTSTGVFGVAGAICADQPQRRASQPRPRRTVAAPRQRCVPARRCSSRTRGMSVSNAPPASRENRLQCVGAVDRCRLFFLACAHFRRLDPDQAGEAAGLAVAAIRIETRVGERVEAVAGNSCQRPRRRVRGRAHKGRRSSGQAALKRTRRHRLRPRRRTPRALHRQLRMSAHRSRDPAMRCGNAGATPSCSIVRPR